MISAELAEILSLPVMQRALVAGAVVGFVTSLIGVVVVLRGYAFLGAGVAHAALPGVALGVISGLPIQGTALAVCSAVAVMSGAVERRGGIAADTAIGIFYAASLALGVMALSAIPSGEIDLMSFLFGSILFVTAEDLRFGIIIGAIVLGVLAFLRKEIVAMLFDHELAMLSGVPVRVLNTMLLILLAAAIVAALQIVGIALASALLVTPAATALQVFRSYSRVIVGATLFGVVMTEAGILAAFVLDTAPGATIVVLMTGIFLAIVASKKGLLLLRG